MVYVLRRPASKAVLHDSRALGECRAYIDSLQNEQFILPHLHILQKNLRILQKPYLKNYIDH